MNNTTATPRERILAVLRGSPDALTARSRLAELQMNERDASIRLKIWRLAAEAKNKLDGMSHPQFINARDTIENHPARALALFGLADEKEIPVERIPLVDVRDPFAWGFDPRPLRNGPELAPNLEPGVGGEVKRRGRHDADEVLSTMIAEKILAGMPHPGAPQLVVNMAPLAEGEIAKAVTKALKAALPKRKRASGWDPLLDPEEPREDPREDPREELNKWKRRAGANKARASRLWAILNAWKDADNSTRESVRVWDPSLGEVIDSADHASSWGLTEEEIHADAAVKREAAEEAFKPTEEIEGKGTAGVWSGMLPELRAGVRRYSPTLGGLLDRATGIQEPWAVAGPNKEPSNHSSRKPRTAAGRPRSIPSTG